MQQFPALPSMVTVLFGTAMICSDTYSQNPPIAVSGKGACSSAELIYALDGRATPECHASTIVETPFGLVAAWFGGSHERHPDVGIWVSRQQGDKWSAPVEVVDGSEGEDKEYACWNPVLFQPSTGPLMLFYKVGVSPELWWGALVTSDDGGKTWSEPRRLGTNGALPEANRNLIGPVKNKPIELDDGNILCPASTENNGWRVHFELTRDGGQSWEVIGPIHDASKFNAIQPSILTYHSGRMQILCRSKENVLVQSWSEDKGKTWGPVTATNLPNPSAGTDAVTLRNGRQLLVFNPTVQGRNILAVATSLDGATWKSVLILEKEETGKFSYPAVIQASDGKVHITYTWMRQSIKHVVLDPTLLRG